MKKPNIITVVIIAAVLLLAVCIGPLIDHISYELRYGTWEYHIDLAGEDRFVLQDYKAAFDHAADAYNSLPTENDIDRDLLSSTCLYMAECLEMIGDSELLVDVLERGYEDTGDSSIYAKLSACPVTFVNKNFLAAVCASVGVDEDALTYSDLQRVEEISISSNSIRIMPGETGSTYPNTKFSVIVYGSERFAAELSRCKNAKVSVSTGVPSDGDLSNLKNIKNLYALAIDHSSVSDISALSEITSLRKLYLHDNQITDLSPLADSTDLNWLVCNQNRIEDISVLSGCTEMETLGLAENPICDLSAVSGMSKLHSISISDTQITDLSPLSGLANLFSVGAENLAVTDWSPISHVWDVSGRPASEQPKE